MVGFYYLLEKPGALNARRFLTVFALAADLACISVMYLGTAFGFQVMTFAVWHLWSNSRDRV